MKVISKAQLIQHHKDLIDGKRRHMACIAMSEEMFNELNLELNNGFACVEIDGVFYTYNK